MRIIVSTGRRLAVVGFMALTAALPARADEPPPAMVILDGSGSMWGTLDGDRTAKFYAVRDVLREQFTKTSPQSRIGFASFGHRRKADCSDVEIIQPPEAASGERINAALDKLNPRGKGPLSTALREAAKSVGSGTPATIIAIHDGVDNCQQDPCAAATEIAKENPRLAIHLISLGLSNADFERISCVPKATGGKAYAADNIAAMANAVTDAFRAANLAIPQGTAPQSAAAAPAEPVAPKGPPGVRLTAVLKAGEARLAQPVAWRVSREDAPDKPLIERSSPEINEPLPPGRYTVEARFGVVTRTSIVDVGENGPTSFQAELDAGTISVDATATKHSDALADPVITIVPSKAPGGANGTANPIWIGRGAAAEVVVQSGGYRVTVRDGLAEAESALDVAAGSRVEAPMVLGTGRLELSALSSSGAAPLGDVIFLIAVDDPDAPQGRREIARSAAPNPTFILKAGTYYVTARLGPAEVRDRIALNTGDVVKHGINLAIGKLSVTASLEGAAAGLSAPIVYRVFQANADSREIAHSNTPNPTFMLPAGRYRLEAQIGTMNVKTLAEADVPAGSETKITMPLKAGQVSVRQSDKASSRSEIRDARGRIVWRSGVSAASTAVLAPGRYIIRFDGANGASEQPFDLAAGEQRVIDLLQR